MTKRKLGKNHGVWCGKVVSGLEFSHEVKSRDNGDVVDRFFKFYVETEITNKEGEVTNRSALPVTVSEKAIDALSKKPVIGSIVFLKGSWRAYDYKNKETNRTRLDQTAYIKIIEVHDEYPVRTRNKFEFEGILVKKLYEFERDENGNGIKDEKGRLVPKRDEEGNIKYVVRKNKEEKIVNDFIVAINRPNGSDYIPCIAYKSLAIQISKEIEVGAEVEGSGYIRERRFISGGVERVAYEAVVTQLRKVEGGEIVEVDMGELNA